VNITSLDHPQTVAPNGEHVDAMLGVKQYAERRRSLGLAGGGERTVRTWLADGRLHGARQMHGVWMIPANEEPAEPMTTGELVAAPAAHAADVQPFYPRGSSELGAYLVERGLADAPAFLELELASRLLGVGVGAIRRHRDYFELVPFGPNGSLVMPAAVVRRVAGLTP
jgi:hypothetical protein